MECKDFFEDMRELAKKEESADKIISAYNRGLITLHEALKELADIEQRRWVREFYKEN